MTGARIRLDWVDQRHAERVAAIADGRIPPALPRAAATVMVLRQVAGDAEVLMLKRPATMAFAAGAYVFPGGSVDEADADPGIGWHGPSPAEFGELLGVPPDQARAIVCAAVRETFEESGVLLAGTTDRSGAVPDGTPWDADRAALAAGDLAFADLLGRRGLVVRADLLTPWTRWITPEAEPRRFDAWFFAAALPAGQHAVGHETETAAAAWIRPEAAIEAARSGSISLLPPTATTLNELAACGGLAEILARRRRITPVCPRFVLDGGHAWLLIPEEADYPL